MPGLYSRPIYRAVLLTIVLLLQSAHSLAESLSVQELLQRMDSNAATMDYYGTLVYSHGKHMETLKRYHAVVDGVRRERLVHLSGKPRETIRSGDHVICLDEKGVKTFGSDAKASPFTRDFSEAVLSADSVYKVINHGQSRVAGRTVIQLSVTPRDSYRYGFRLALDEETQLLLQSFMLDDAGEVIERYEYSDISIGEPFDPALLQPQLAVVKSSDTGNSQASPASKDGKVRDGKKAPKPEKEANSSAPVDEKLWRLSWVPQGFAVQKQAGSETGGANSPLLRSGRVGSLMYSDGLSAFTVFVADNVNLGNRSHRSGATTAYTQVKNKDNAVYSVTVVGEIPRVAAQKVAMGVVPVRH